MSQSTIASPVKMVVRCRSRAQLIAPLVIALAVAPSVARAQFNIICGVVWTQAIHQEWGEPWCTFACLEFVANELLGYGGDQCDFVVEACARIPKLTCDGNCCGTYCHGYYLTGNELSLFMDYVGFQRHGGGMVSWQSGPTATPSQLYDAICDENYLISAHNEMGSPLGHAVVVCVFDIDSNEITIMDPYWGSYQQEITFAELKSGSYQGGFGLPMIAFLRVGYFDPKFVGIDDITRPWVDEHVPTQSVTLKYGVYWTADPDDSTCLYISDNPWGPVRRVLAAKPLSQALPYGEEAIVSITDVLPYVEHAFVRYFLDHGPGGFAALRSPDDLKSCVNNPVELFGFNVERDTLDAPDLLSLVPSGPDPQVGIRLVWELSDDDAIIDYYNVYRQEDLEYNPGWIWLASVPRGTSSFVDDVNIFTGVNYTYRVSAAHHGGNPSAGNGRKGIYNDFSEPITGVAKMGEIANNETWSGNVFATGDITVQSGKTLTIAAGTHIWIWPVDTSNAGVDHDRVEIKVDGTLVANGATASPIVFESWNGQPQTTQDWWGIFVNAGGDGAFEHCAIRNTRWGIGANAPISVVGCTIESTAYRGINIASAGTVIVDNTTIRGPEYGINALNGTNLILSNSTIEDCSSYGVALYKGSKLNATETTFDGNDIGLYLARETTAWVKGTVHDCTFSNNTDGIWIDDVGELFGGHRRLHDR